MFNYQHSKFPVPTSWNLEEFESLLGDDYYDKNLITLLRYGWPIETTNLMELHSIPENQKGARENFESLTDYVSKELAQKSILGPFSKNPFGKAARFSPIDAIPKKDSEDKRIILNLSFPPEGGSVNDAVSKDTYLGVDTKLTFPTVDDVCKLVLYHGTGCALMKTDLKKYYRQIYYDLGCVHLTGFSIVSPEGKTFLYWDITLSMGLRIACYIAQRVSNAIMYIFAKKDHTGVNYIDDLAAVARWSRAFVTFKDLTDILARLGMWEAVHKRFEPDVVMPFLGVNIHTIKLIIFLTAERVADIRNETSLWLDKNNASRKDVQKLVGKLNFAATTVRSGRLFYSRILNFLRTLPKHGIHTIPGYVKKDIAWWHKFLLQYDGVSLIHEPEWRSIDSVISTDACLVGLGGFSTLGEYFHCKIPDQWSSLKLSINELECFAVVLALRIWGPQLAGLNILLHCDNESTVAVVNRGKAKHTFTQACLREIMFLAGQFSFQVRVPFIPGVTNRIADCLSRWSLGQSFRDSFFSEAEEIADVTKLKHILVSDDLFKFLHDW